MIKRILLLTLGFSLAVGGFWAGQAQDPTPQKQPSMVRTDPPTVAAQSVQTDLSGTYAGTFNCDALGLTGDTTLTITGNEFTTADGKTGRIVASTTHGYTAVALQLNPPAATTTPGAPATTAAPMIVSVRARKSGNRLTLSPVAGATMKCSFMPGRSVARGRRGQRTPAATGTEVSAPAAVPTVTPAETPMPSQTPSPSPTPNPSPTASPTPSPEPMPSPTPTGSPRPAPSPTEPAPSPTPSPSPSPSPSPGK